MSFIHQAQMLQDDLEQVVLATWAWIKSRVVLPANAVKNGRKGDYLTGVVCIALGLSMFGATLVMKTIYAWIPWKDELAFLYVGTIAFAMGAMLVGRALEAMHENQPVETDPGGSQ